MTNAVNLPITLGGFTFRGIHSSEFGVRQTPGDRVLSPLKRRSLLQIPGRPSAVVQEDGGYDSRVETIECSYVRQEGVSLQRQVRLIAGWLNGVGELSYDYEPEMLYNAYLSSSPPTVKTLQYATFTLEFTINHPFAYETAQQIARYNMTEGDSNKISVDVGGTIETPVRIIIKNNGPVPITGISILAKSLKD